ncbi:MAG: RecX family transcriptional regulator [Dehalococcoidia bacterium]|nr:RecX family transcriptional regulator [Dehalococcoidia bacterium]
MDSEHPRIAEIRGLRRKRRTLILDDGREFVFSDEACERLHIRRGMVASPELIASLGAEERRASLHEAALNLLSYRMRSEAELRRRLRLRGADGEAIDEELERLRNAGLVDDARFAAMWVGERTSAAPRSGRMLRAELRAKGISAEMTADATSGVDDDAAALELARSRARRVSAPDYQAFRARVGGALQRRGFDFATTERVVRTAWTEAHGSFADDE